MSESVLVTWSDALLQYDMGVTHPMAPGRLEFTMALARDLDVVARPGVTVEAPNPAPDDVLQLIHDPAYVAAVRDAAERHAAPLAEFGLGSQDNPVFDRMHEASVLVAGGTVDAAAPSAAARPSMPSTSRAGCTTRCPPRPPGSAYTTTLRSRSFGCWPTASGGLLTSTWTPTTVTVSRRRSITTPEC